MTLIVLNLKTFTDHLSDRDLAQLSTDNPDARLETDSIGQLIVISPTGGESRNISSGSIERNII